MNTFHYHPEAIKRIHGKGFVDYTITRRLPKILSNIEEQLQANGRLEAAQVMLQAVIDEKNIDLDIFARPTAYWEEYLDKLSGLTWGDLPFFDLEFLFYHGLNSIAGYFEAGIDVFYHARRMALAEAISALNSGVTGLSELSGMDLLDATIRCSLFANEADYSQLVTSRSDSALWSDRVLLDESEQLISGLGQVSSGTEVHLIADNAGHELCWDLVMVDAILRVFDGIRVVIHVKPWPMFVSDALTVDVEETINGLLDSNLCEDVRLIGQRLRRAIESGQFQVFDEADWGEPRHFNALDENLGTKLSNSAKVISKGDLNYRRFVRDLQWQTDIPVEVATVGVPFKAIALRVLKSDALVGIESSIAIRAAQKFNDWRTCGHFAIVQSL